jgi:hypothetical protein
VSSAQVVASIRTGGGCSDYSRPIALQAREVGPMFALVDTPAIRMVVRLIVRSRFRQDLPAQLLKAAKPRNGKENHK